MNKLGTLLFEISKIVVYRIRKVGYQNNVNNSTKIAFGSSNFRNISRSEVIKFNPQEPELLKREIFKCFGTLFKFYCAATFN